MTHTYKLTGMTCGGCEAGVKSSLLKLPNITAVEVSKENQSATITMDKLIPLAALQNALEKKYAITALEHNEVAEQTKNWLSTYKPILLIFAYISVIALIAGTNGKKLDWMKAMNTFMAGFFLTFSFFKMLDLKAFTESYAMYDVVAKKVKSWGFIYVFIELSLGIAYATGFEPLLTNIVTLAVMSVSIIGVLQSVLNKRKIKCACLGAVFNLPMSTVTIIEDAVMIAMSAVMLITLF
ncbi:MAG: cation transporter [Bacteroidota bacterium]